MKKSLICATIQIYKYICKIHNLGVDKMTSSRIMLKSQQQRAKSKGRGNSAYFVMPFMWMNNGVLRPLQNSERSTPFHFCNVSNEGGRPP